MITVLVADDHPLICHSIRLLLKDEADLQIVGEANNGLEAKRLAESLKPDILVADLMMAGLNGLELTRLLHQSQAETRVVILSMHGTEAYVSEALRSGAAGYVLKDSSPGELVQAIRAAAGGGRYLSASLSEMIVEAYTNRLAETKHDPFHTLTERERAVLRMAGEGYTNTAIAASLSISPRTVETHRANLMRKLGLHNQSDLIHYAVKRGIVAIEL